jgi:hypothetical protein
VKNARRAQVNRVRAELGLQPPTAHQIAHDRSLAEPKGLSCRERSCAMSSVRREKVDEPFLASLLDSYIDLDETRRRLEVRMESELSLAREAVGEREAEVAGIERALTATGRGLDAGGLSDRQYAKREARLTEESWKGRRTRSSGLRSTPRRVSRRGRWVMPSKWCSTNWRP